MNTSAKVWLDGADENLRLRIPPRHFDKRSVDQIREHYLVERELATRLKQASAEERRTLYTAVYDEMFRRVPHHPMLHADAAARPSHGWNLSFLKRFLSPETIYLEVGPGDCAFACHVAPLVKQVYAVDVSEQLTNDIAPPPNFRLFISDGTSIPVPPASVDVAFSDQLMEHLHPDDALKQLSNIYRSLAPGGRYVCITPNRLYGPSDQSQYFDEVATCFHLKEYCVGEMHRLLREAGFSRTTFYIGARGLFMPSPRFAIRSLELTLERFPYEARKFVADRKPLRALLGIRVVARK